MSYKLSLIKAIPNEMKSLAAYSFKIGAKLIVDELGFVGFTKENLDVNYPEGPDAAPPEDVEAFPGIVSIPCDDNLEAKKQAVLDLYQWSQKLDGNFFRKVEIIKVPEGAPEEEQTSEAWLRKIS